ncbi:hypothetical protein LCGC14_1211800 [marine sediment metagenome]|uniref:Sigma 54 modulation/S30EA ribosomal protein C-terminal domain-containing protein n=1 Tax=marine sediment metagenome TaxID=412755 RepID=A0A0F9NW57_9ZZZZ
MQIDISGSRTCITEQIDGYIKKKLSSLNKYFRRILSIRVTIRAEKDAYLTEISVIADGVTVHGNGIGSDLYNSIEAAIHKVNRQARKHKEKIKSHRSRDTLAGKRTSCPSSPASSGAEYKTTYTSKEIAKPMTADEAVMQLEMERSRFFIFLNNNTNQINVAYKKENGVFVVIEPQI